MADIQLGKMLQPAASSAQDLEVPYLRAGHLSLVPDELPRMWASPREVVQYRVETDDILVAEGGDVGRVGFVPLSASGALIQNSLHRVRPRGGRDRRFLAYVLEAVYLGDWLEVLCNKSTFGHLTVEKLKGLRVPDPPVAKQRAIADYLDTETARIDALIEKKQQMIKLLDERLQIRRKQFFSDNRGWKLKHLLRGPMAYGILVPRFVEPESGVRMLRITNLDSSGGVDLSEVAWVPSALSGEYRRTLVGAGDLVISVVGSMGRASVISREVGGSNLNRALARVQLRSDLDPWIIWHWTQTTEFLDQALLATGGGTAQPTLNLGDLAEFTVGLSTNPKDWPRIAAILSDAHQSYLSLDSALRRQIDVLRQLRQALITSAVTGELEVPGVAA